MVLGSSAYLWFHTVESGLSEFTYSHHRELSKVPHMATTPGDEETVQYMLKRWQDPDTGLDDAWREEYAVYLSFPDSANPNKVTVGE